MGATSAAALAFFLGGVVSAPTAVGATSAVAAYRTVTWSSRIVAQAKANVLVELESALAHKGKISLAFAEAFLDQLKANPVMYSRLALLIVRRQQKLAAEREALASLPALSDSWLLVDYQDAVLGPDFDAQAESNIPSGASASSISSSGPSPGPRSSLQPPVTVHPRDLAASLPSAPSTPLPTTTTTTTATTTTSAARMQTTAPIPSAPP